MKRQIKFRGKLVIPYSDVVWEYGYLIVDDDDKTAIMSTPENVNQYSIEDFICEVIPETVGQFTGLKDKNGVDIYEGDILTNEYEFVGMVQWDNNYSCFWVGTEWEYFNINSCRDDNSVIEGYWVVGNIYDNPNLLDFDDDYDNQEVQ